MEYSVHPMWCLISSIGGAVDPLCDLDWDPYDDSKFAERIHELFTDDSGYTNDYFRILKRHMVMMCRIENIDSTLLYSMICSITDRRTASQVLFSLDDYPKVWRELLIAAKARAQRSKHSIDIVRAFESRPLMVSESAIRLRDEFGIEIEVQEGIIEIHDSNKRIVANEIERLVIECGAQNVFECIMQHSQKIYDANQDRYLNLRTPKMGPNYSPPPPFGYLMQLALKNWNSVKEPGSDQARIWPRIVQLASDLLRVEDVEQHNSFEIFISSSMELTKLLEDIAVFDTVYHFPQMNYESLRILLVELFGWIDEEMVERKIGFNLNHVIELAEYVENAGGDGFNGLLHIRKDEIRSFSQKLSEENLDSMLSFLTHSIGMVNENYILPRDHKHIDSWFKPFVSDAYGEIYVPCKHISNVGFYESCFRMVRECYPESKYENEMGTRVEGLLRSILGRSNVTVYFGDYAQNGSAGDVDAALVSDTEILLFEVKKKSLTRAARSGQQYNILMDMGLSNGKAMSQLFKHEAILLRDGYLALENPEGEQRIQWDGKRIIKFVVTLFEYGGLSDKNLLKHFVEMQIFNDISVDESATASQKKKVAEFNSIGQELRDWVALIYPVELDASWYMSCWSVSIPYVLLALRDRELNETMIESLLYTQNISMATCDIFRERRETKKIRHVQKGLTE